MPAPKAIILFDFDKTINVYDPVEDFDYDVNSIKQSPDQLALTGAEVGIEAPEIQNFSLGAVIKNPQVVKSMMEILNSEGVLCVPGSQRIVFTDDKRQQPYLDFMYKMFDRAFGEQRDYLTREQADQIVNKLSSEQKEGLGDNKNKLIGVAKEVFGEESISDAQIGIFDDMPNIVGNAKQAGYALSAQATDNYSLQQYLAHTMAEVVPYDAIMKHVDKISNQDVKTQLLTSLQQEPKFQQEQEAQEFINKISKSIVKEIRKVSKAADKDPQYETLAGKQYGALKDIHFTLTSRFTEPSPLKRLEKCSELLESANLKNLKQGRTIGKHLRRFLNVITLGIYHGVNRHLENRRGKMVDQLQQRSQQAVEAQRGRGVYGSDADSTSNADSTTNDADLLKQPTDDAQQKQLEEPNPPSIGPPGP